MIIMIFLRSKIQCLCSTVKKDLLEFTFQFCTYMLVDRSKVTQYFQGQFLICKTKLLYLSHMLLEGLKLCNTAKMLSEAPAVDINLFQDDWLPWWTMWLVCDAEKNNEVYPMMWYMICTSLTTFLTLYYSYFPQVFFPS